MSKKSNIVVSSSFIEGADLRDGRDLPFTRGIGYTFLAENLVGKAVWLTPQEVNTILSVDASDSSLQNSYDFIPSGLIGLSAAGGGITIRDNATPIPGSLFNVQNSTGAISYLGVTTSAVTVGSGVTLSTISTGNINLPNNGSSRFKIEGVSVGSTVTSVNLDTLTNGSNADLLHTHSILDATQIKRAGLTTTGLADGDFGYISANNIITKTDASSILSARLLGANEGVVGSMTLNGVIENAKFTTAGGSPSPGFPVYLALASDDVGTAAGKLSAVAPSVTGQVVAEVGVIIDNSNYAALKTCVVVLRIKPPVVL